MFVHDIQVFVVFITCYSAGRTNEKWLIFKSSLGNRYGGTAFAHGVDIGGRLEIQFRLIVSREHNTLCKQFFFFLRRFMQGCARRSSQSFLTWLFLDFFSGGTTKSHVHNNKSVTTVWFETDYLSRRNGCFFTWNSAPGSFPKFDVQIWRAFCDTTAHTWIGSVIFEKRLS